MRKRENERETEVERKRENENEREREAHLLAPPFFHVSVHLFQAQPRKVPHFFGPRNDLNIRRNKFYLLYLQ